MMSTKDHPAGDISGSDYHADMSSSQITRIANKPIMFQCLTFWWMIFSFKRRKKKSALRVAPLLSDRKVELG